MPIQISGGGSSNMIHFFPGNLGHLFVILAFVAALFATISFYLSTRDPKWNKMATWGFHVHGISVIGVVVVLFYIINQHYFEYHYVWSHSSTTLPWYYQISCFWEGQEGSFLLWMLWNVAIGWLLMATNKEWKHSVMTIMSLTQVFLTSMILGVVIFENLKVGSSPFLLLRDVLDAPIFATNPNYVPADGSGLNPLLQNYWMVIHPPTLFLGFAMTVVPFAFCMAGLWRKKYTEWIRPALPWMQVSLLVLGVGILMGAYWAYETLNFGGFWNWDPVENAIYVPWLIMAAAMHTMIIQKRKSSALKISIILTVTSFLLVLYSTYLVRSGVLGEASVHSFTDAGLSNQLLIYLGLFFTGTLLLVSLRWKSLPGGEQDVSIYTREFWIFMGTATLSLMALQVIWPTSIPAFNRLMAFVGTETNIAIPADQVGFYSYWQLFFAVMLGILSGTGQFFWWNRITPKELWKRISLPIVLALTVSAFIFILVKVYQWEYMLLVVASCYTIIANASLLRTLVKKNVRLSGGSIAHMGIGLMLLGILFSSGYEKMLSTNYTGRAWSNDLPEEVNRDNLLLFINEARQMDDYSLLYKGMRKKTNEAGYVPAHYLSGTSNPNRYTLNRNYSDRFRAGDTLHLTNGENSYFEIDYKKSEGRTFTLFPRVQMNETMDMIVLSPDIRHRLDADVYTHVRTFPDPASEVQWAETDTLRLAKDEQFFVNDYVATFKGASIVKSLDGFVLEGQDFAVRAEVEIQGEFQTYQARPVYIVQEDRVGRIADEVQELGVELSILAIDAPNNRFVFGTKTRQKDWVIIEAVEKPMINLLWLGTFFLVAGLTIASTRRYKEFKRERNQ